MDALRAYAKADPGQLRYEEAPIPIPEAGDALVRVRACAFTPNELAWPAVWTNPDGSARPVPIVPGHEVSGMVEALGPETAGVAVGDAVYGLIDFQRDGGAAELVAARATEMAAKPTTLDHLAAAATPLSALTAWQALFEHAGLEPGQRVLIHGAAGGVGSFAVQLARWRGAEVVATAAARHASALRDLGAEAVIDYRSTAFDAGLAGLDVVLDTVGGDTWERSWRVLRPGGVLVSVAVPRPPAEDRRPDARAVWFVVRADRGQLAEIARLIDAGHVHPVVARSFPLADGRMAFESAGHDHALGKFVLVVPAAATAPAVAVAPSAAASPAAASA